MNLTRPSRFRRLASRGFTLIELLISMTIGLVLIGALGIIMARFEQSKRQNSTTMDLAQSTGYMAYDLDRQIRSAGSGMFVSRAMSFGCPLAAARNNAQILPRLTAFPAPFAAVPAALLAAPIMVFPGAAPGGSDLIQVTTFGSGLSETPMQVKPGSATVNSLALINTMGLRSGDLLMMQESSLPCMIVQVGPNFTGSAASALPLAGTRFLPAIGTTALITYGRTGGANVMPIGNANGNQPQVQLLGVNANQQLVSYDALQFNNIPGTDEPVPLAENVMDLRAVYGIDNNEDGTVDRWVSPSTAPFNPANMYASSTGAQGSMASIVAVRIAMIVRGERIEKETDPRVSPTSLTMFATLDPALQRVYNISDQERRRNYRLVELAVPIRNAILSASKRTPPA